MSLESLKVDLTGQTAIVTGASQGLGRAMAIALAGAGARVACVARNAEKLAATVAAIKEAGGEGEVMAANVSDSEAVDTIVTTVAEQWGQLDIMVNNAATRAGGAPRSTGRRWTARQKSCAPALTRSRPDEEKASAERTT